MARTYAAIMALLALLVVIMRGVKNHAGCQETVLIALAWMSLLGAIGFIIGAIARSTVDQSVLTKIESQLADYQAAKEAAEPEPTA